MNENLKKEIQDDLKKCLRKTRRGKRNMMKKMKGNAKRKIQDDLKKNKKEKRGKDGQEDEGEWEEEENTG